jgi:hypothetical protein
LVNGCERAAGCNPYDDLDGGVDGALAGLLQQSLVYRVDMEAPHISGEEDEQAIKRFNMLEMLREYASERLAERENE